MPARSGETIQDARRAPLTLGRLIKSGGAGSVFLLKERPLEVAKLYHPSVDTRVYERKLKAMLELSPDLPDVQEKGVRHVQIAWPTGLLHDRSGRFIGFSMPVLDIAATSDLEHVLQERQARAEGLPTALGAKAALAANLAVMLAALHRRQHYVVDLKPLNVRFYRKSLFIAMLDCDGFSIQGKDERFPAGQVTTDYLAPEFQQRGVKAGQEEAQDRFALAVMVFQLLNSGLHPYSGRPQDASVPSDLPGRIAANLYPYGRGNMRLQPSPVSGHQAFPEALRQMFDRAFSDRPGQRPSAEEWASLLQSYARRSAGMLVKCGKDASHQHFSGMPCAACARKTLLANSARATKARATRKTTKAQHQHQQRPRATGTRTVQPVQGHAMPVQAARPAAPPGLGVRLLMAIVGPLLLGWAISWGMPAYRGYKAAANPGWGDAMMMGMQGGLLLFAVLLFVVFVPVLILGKRP